MTDTALKITREDVDSAQDTSRILLGIAGAHPPNIGIGALIMATAVAAREMNMSIASIAAMFDRTLAGVYAAAEPENKAPTLN